MGRIIESYARQMWDEGRPTRLVTSNGYAARGFNSAATRHYGLNSFNEWRDFQIEFFERMQLARSLHWEKPVPSRRTHDEAAGAIFRREEFEIGSLSGTHFFDPHGAAGDLPAQWREAFVSITADHGFVDYAVWSYETPIAWVRTDGHIVMPPVRYSLTTTQHQSLVARAFGLNGFMASESAHKGRGKTPYTHREGWA